MVTRRAASPPMTMLRDVQIGRIFYLIMPTRSQPVPRVALGFGPVNFVPSVTWCSIRGPLGVGSVIKSA